MNWDLPDDDSSEAEPSTYQTAAKTLMSQGNFYFFPNDSDIFEKIDADYLLIG